MSHRSVLLFLIASFTLTGQTSLAQTAKGNDLASARNAVREYHKQYLRMRKEQGDYKASSFFLAPDFTATMPDGKATSRTKWLAGIEAHQSHVASKTVSDSPKRIGTPESIVRIEGDKVIETITSSSIQNRKNSPSAFLPDSKEQERRYVQVNRYVFVRAPDGLRLQSLQNVGMQVFIDGKPLYPTGDH